MPRSSCSDPRPMSANMAHCWDASFTVTWAVGSACQVLAWLFAPAAHPAVMLGVRFFMQSP